MNATVVDSNFVSLSFYLLVVGGLLKVGVQDGSNGLQNKKSHHLQYHNSLSLLNSFF